MHVISAMDVIVNDPHNRFPYKVAAYKPGLEVAFLWKNPLPEYQTWGGRSIKFFCDELGSKRSRRRVRKTGVCMECCGGSGRTCGTFAAADGKVGTG
jgi:hypothetical protein